MNLLASHKWAADKIGLPGVTPFFVGWCRLAAMKTSQLENDQKLLKI